MRINARLDDEHAEKLTYLTRTTGASVTEVLKQALDVYFEQLGNSCGSAAQILEQSGFIGCGEGSPHLSEQYKESLKKSLATKHAHR